MAKKRTERGSMSDKNEGVSAHSNLPVLNIGRGALYYLRDIFETQQERRAADDGARVKALSFMYEREAAEHAKQDAQIKAQHKNDPDFFYLLFVALAAALQSKYGIELCKRNKSDAERALSTPAIRQAVEDVLDAEDPLPEGKNRWDGTNLDMNRRPYAAYKDGIPSDVKPGVVRLSRTIFDRTLPLTKQKRIYSGPAKTFNDLAADWKNIRQFNLSALKFELDFAKAARADDQKALTKLGLKNNFYYASVQASYIQKGLLQFKADAATGLPGFKLTDNFKAVDGYIGALQDYVDNKLRPWAAAPKKPAFRPGR